MKKPEITFKQIFSEEDLCQNQTAKYNEKLPFVALKKDTPLKGQLFAVISVLTPDDYGLVYQKNETPYRGFMIKVHGVFPDTDTAHNFIQKKMKMDPHFDIHLIKTGAWSKIDNDVDSIEDNIYSHKMMNDIMTGYFRNENNKKISMDERIQRLHNGEMKQDYSDIKKLLKESLVEDLDKYHRNKTKEDFLQRLHDVDRPRRTLEQLAQQQQEETPKEIGLPDKINV